MEPIYVKDLIEITKGSLLCGAVDDVIVDIATDSRNLKEGDLFVPLIGERVDAHKFLDAAIQDASVAFTMEHDAATDAMLGSGHSVIRVEDTLLAMQKVASYIRHNHPLPIIGVTGSVGKTTTREMIYTALASEKKTFQTYKNYNSQVGVPLTMAKLTDEYELAVLEMGMSNPGEMERLATMIRPNMAVFTCVGVAHIENLKTQENICLEKLKIATYMKDEDILFLNGDDPILRKLSSTVSQQIIWYGTTEDCQYRGKDIHVDCGEQVFTLVCAAGEYEVRLKALGEHNVRNALVAIGVAEQYGVAIQSAIQALYTFQGQRQRVVETAFFTMIDDTYNASPDSMKASLAVLRDMPCNGKRIAVLADMLELGENEVLYHEQVGQYVKEDGIDYLIAYGELSKHMIKTAGCEGVHVDSLEAAETALRNIAKPEDTVLLKGSNGMHLKEIVEHFS